MSEEPWVRFAARAIIIDGDGRTLLFRAQVPGHPRRFIWITPGGGINEGEDDVSCVCREVFEETGHPVIEVGPCVWLRDHTFPWGERVLRQVESYYVVRTEAFEVTTDNHEELERTFLTAHRWFTLDELRAHDETLVPGDFADLFAPLMTGDRPSRSGWGSEGAFR